MVVVLPLTATVAEPRWHQVWLNGERVGALITDRIVNGNEVRNTETFSVTLARADTDVSIRTVETHIETVTGEALGFELDQELGNTRARVTGARDGADWLLREHDGNTWRERRFTFPAGALLGEGAHLFDIAQMAKGNVDYRYTVFDPSSSTTMVVQTRVGGQETVPTPIGSRQGRKVTQSMQLAGATLDSISWIDADGELVYARMPMLGTTLEIVASTEADASKSARGGDLFSLTTVAPPRKLSTRQRTRDIDYRVRVDGQVDLPKRAGEQRVVTLAGTECDLPPGSTSLCLGVSVDMAPATRSDRRAPGADDKTPNSWVQSDDPKIVAFARKATAAATSDVERMLALERAVSARLSDKNLSSAYASAREAFDDRSGDCTEHALLLAASARSLGIATRIAAGLAYTDSFAGRSHVMVPHAWVQSYVDGRWQSFDAALGRFDSGHLLLSVGNGDPGMYFGSLNALGNLSIHGLRIAPVP